MPASEQDLTRWGGRALVAGGVLLVVGTVLHPSQETPTTILEMEARLVGSHAVSVVAYLLILLGLPVMYGAALGAGLAWCGVQTGARLDAPHTPC